LFFGVTGSDYFQGIEGTNDVLKKALNNVVGVLKEEDKT
jgi:hypothetical protein